jgi:hypothetical protein
MAMVREARFSWDDAERIDPNLRRERPEPFEGPDDDWVRDLRHRKRRRKTSLRGTRPNRSATSRDSGSGCPGRAAPGSGAPVRPANEDSRRHLAGADWLSTGNGSRATCSEPEKAGSASAAEAADGDPQSAPG